MIYALIDRATLDRVGWSIQKISKKIESLNIEIAQYRDKDSSLQEQLDNIIEIQKYYSGKLIINDKYRVDRLCRWVTSRAGGY